MPKAIITIEDQPNGKVKIAATPNFTEIVKMDLSGHALTPALTYALKMLNAALEMSRENNPDNESRIIRPS